VVLGYDNNKQILFTGKRFTGNIQLLSGAMKWQSTYASGYGGQAKKG